MIPRINNFAHKALAGTQEIIRGSLLLFGAVATLSSMKELVWFVMLLSIAPVDSAILSGRGCDASNPVFTDSDRLTSQGRHPEARTLLEAALIDLERAPPEKGDHTVSCILDRLGTNMVRIGDLKQGAIFKLRAVETSRTSPLNRTTAVLANNLAATYAELNELDAAERWAQEALSIALQTTGENHPDRLLVYTTLAAIYGYRGDFARAEPLYRRALFHFEKSLGSGHVEVGLTAGNLADIYRTQERHGEAIVLYRKAIAAFESPARPYNRQLLWARSGLMVSCASSGRTNEAESLSKAVIASAERLSPKNDPMLSTVLHRLALVRLSQQDLVGAEALLKRTVSILEASHGSESSRIIPALQTLAHVLRASKDRRTAKQVESRIKKLTMQPDR